MALRFNPAPGWPQAPQGWEPPPGWQPDPDWPPVPEGWQLWVDDQQPLFAAPAPGPAGRLSKQAVSSLILGILGFTFVTGCLGILFGSLALGNIRRNRLRGRGMAVTGIVLSCIWIALGIIGLVALAASHDLNSNGSGNSSASTSTQSPSSNGGTGVSVFSLVRGDCFDNPTSSATASVTTVVKTACTAAHNAQIYATFRVSGGMLSYPGSAKMLSRATAGCNARAAANLDKSKVTNAMGIRFLFPEQASWLAGRRTISCMIVNPTPTLTSSLLSSGAG